MRILVCAIAFALSLVFVIPVMGAAKDPPIKAPTSVAVDSKDYIYLISQGEIQVYTPERKFVEKMKIPTEKGNAALRKITIDNDDNMLVTDGKRIYRADFSDERPSVVVEGGEACDFSGLTVDSEGHILVANSSAERVEIYTAKGELLGTFSKKSIMTKEGEKDVEKEIGDPRDVFVRDGRAYVAHRDGVTIWKYDAKKAEAEFEEFIEHKWDCISCVVDSKGRLYSVSTSNSFWCYEINVIVRERDEKGKWQQVARNDGDPYRFIEDPQELAVNSKDDILICDKGNDRILIENAETFDGPKHNYKTWKETFDAAQPKIDNITQTSATVSWTTNEEMASGVYFYGIKNRKSQYISTKKGTERSVTLKGLEPGTRYELMLAPFGRNIPYFKGSRHFRFVTKPPEGKTEYIKLPVLAVVFKNIIRLPEDFDAKDIPKIKEQTPDSEMEKIRRELDMAELFYWVNSGLRFCLDIEMLVIDDFYFDAPLGDFFYPKEEGHRKIREMLRERGVNVGKYGGVCVLNCIRNYDPETKEFTYDRGTGGGTIGTYPPIEGFSSWRGFSNNAWLFTHEFGHSIDIKFQRSGMPEYPINHFMIEGDYGTHYDGIAFQSRMWGERWLRMNFGELVLADDKDNDGIPDDDPGVPLDEKRFKSDPTKTDTDEDGLSDYDEIMASKWIWDGENDRTADGYFKPDPRKKDTDGDGIADGKDEYPLYPYPGGISRRKDAAAKPTKFAEIDDPALKATISLSWDKDSLVFTIDVDRPAEIRIQLDPKNDGFVGESGKDNYAIKLGKDAEKVEGRAASADIARIQVARFVSGTSARQGIGISIPKNDKAGLTLKKGDTIGFLVYFRPEGYKGKEITPFEPNAWFDIKLAE